MARLIRYRGKLKGYFFVMKFHRLIPGKLLVFLGQLSELSKWISKHKDFSYSDFYTDSFDYHKRLELYKNIIEKENITGDIDYFEFGVASGSSFGWWLNAIRDEKSRFYGFDTFTGLPEDWGSFKKGDMSNNNEAPKFNDNRHTFYQGLFQQTLPGFLKSYQGNRRKIIHMDADLYSSTLFVLTSLSPFINKGDIIMFDEFNVPLHEYKAFTEWTDSYYIKCEILGAINNYYQTSFKII